MSSMLIEFATVIRPAPIPTRTALNLMAPLLPYLSVRDFPSILPRRPPIVNKAVTAENWVSDMGIHAGRP